jgi:N-acetylmuramoyl-L-alanine amidase
MIKSTAMARFFDRSAVCILATSLLGTSVHAGEQQLVPIIRAVDASSSSVSVWKTFIRIADYGGKPFVSLNQAAALFGGKVSWSPVSKAVDLSVRGHRVRFFFNSARALLDGRESRLPYATLKNAEGFWVPTAFFAGQRFFRLSGQRMEWPPRKVATAPKPARRIRPLAASQAAAAPEPVTRRRETRAVRRIVVDPGHGGKIRAPSEPMALKKRRSTFRWRRTWLMPCAEKVMRCC